MWFERSSSKTVFSILNHTYVRWTTHFQSFFETGWATHPCFDADYWLIDAPCDNAQKPGGHWKDFDALKSNFDTLKGNIGA